MISTMSLLAEKKRTISFNFLNGTSKTRFSGAFSFQTFFTWDHKNISKSFFRLLKNIFPIGKS